MHKSLLENLFNTKADTVAPTFIVMIVKVNKTDNAVLEVSLPL